MSLAVALAALVLANPAAKPAEPAQEALASWYDDAGTTASGTHYAYGYASLMFRPGLGAPRPSATPAAAWWGAWTTTGPT